MAADAYLKVAAGQLQQAANALKQEAGQIRGEAAAKRQQMERDIVNMQAEMNAKSLLMAANNTDPAYRASLANEVRQLQAKIDQAKQAEQKERGDAEQAARDKEGAMGRMAGKAQELNGMANDASLK